PVLMEARTVPRARRRETATAARARWPETATAARARRLGTTSAARARWPETATAARARRLGTTSAVPEAPIQLVARTPGTPPAQTPRRPSTVRRGLARAGLMAAEGRIAAARRTMMAARRR